MNIQTGDIEPLDAYARFLAAKAILDPLTGLSAPPELPQAMFEFQRDITRWALRRGRAGIFAGTGLGKTFMELAWGDAIREEARRPILQFAPLAVSAQIVREAVKFGIPARLVTSSLDADPDHVCVVNYQKMDHFDFTDFGGVTLDESSILKSTDGHFRKELTERCAQIPFRLAATATPAPNDFMELGNHAEFLGVMSQSDMLSTFFAHDGGSTQNWRLRGHAENDFWRWMASWSVMIQKPSDIGYSDEGYDLPPLVYHNHSVEVEDGPSAVTGLLFAKVAETLSERSAARRDSMGVRVAQAIAVTPHDRPFVWWCHLNSESEALTAGIPGAVEVRGSDKDTDKERKLIDFSEGRIRVLVTKPSIAGFGMNWQHCADTGFVGLSDSFEQFYQAVRRFWRFGQTQQVNCHIISAKTEGNVLANIRRKESDAARMSAAMVEHMGDLSSAAIRGSVRDKGFYNPTVPVSLPAFLQGEIN